MRALVISNCATQGYVAALKAAFPDWDIRGIVHRQANEWAEQGHEGFLDFAGKLDLLVGLTNPRQKFMRHIAPAVRRVTVPPFVWAGLHPDTIWLRGFVSPLGAGDMHSRLIVAAWLAGLDPAATRALFCHDHMAAMGYLDAHDRERDALLARFATAGIDLRTAFDNWWHDGNFMHTANHPKPFVFFDIALAAVEAAGFTPQVDRASLASARGALDDYLGRGIIWRLYPEIAAHHGLPRQPDHWRTAAGRGEGVQFGLDEMIARSRAILDHEAHRRDEILDMVGGEARVAALVAA